VEIGKTFFLCLGAEKARERDLLKRIIFHGVDILTSHLSLGYDSFTTQEKEGMLENMGGGCPAQNYLPLQKKERLLKK